MGERWLLPLALAPGVVLAFAACSAGGTAESVPVVAISAHQWAFSPDTITLKKGAAVDLELTSTDVHHGFSLPDFACAPTSCPARRPSCASRRTGLAPFFSIATSIAAPATKG
jgi:hypothetical protein